MRETAPLASMFPLNGWFWQRKQTHVGTGSGNGTGRTMGAGSGNGTRRVMGADTDDALQPHFLQNMCMAVCQVGGGRVALGCVLSFVCCLVGPERASKRGNWVGDQVSMPDYC